MRDFGKIKTIVVKVGTNILSAPEGIDHDRFNDIVRQVATLIEADFKVLLVSSGAIGMGAKALKHFNPVKHIPLRQACAAIGNPMLMTAYQEAFSKYNLLCGQVLITRGVLNNRTGYNNMRSAVTTMLQLGVVPIFNENDVVSTSEINNVFGDNDRMSAYVASKIDADLLVLMTDIDGVYTGNPKSDSSAVLLSEISEITPEIFGYAKGSGSTFATGGMRTKLLAAEIAQRGGCGTLIISGYEQDSLIHAVQGFEVGTYILPEKRLAQRQRWIYNASASGFVVVDNGAERALTVGHKSLLPSGVKDVQGIFKAGDVIEIRSQSGDVIMKAITSFNSSDLLRVMGHSSRDVAKILGELSESVTESDMSKASITKSDVRDVPKVVFRPEDSVYVS